jgi:hypothetical protein
MQCPERYARGATLVEFAIVVPLLLFIFLGIVQTALAFHAKSNLNYAAFEAVRTGGVEHARPSAMFAAFERALVPYYGGGASSAELAQRLTMVHADLARGSARLEILSPTSKSFDDFNSPELSSRFGGGVRVIPNTNIMMLQCPRDRPNCPGDPATNSSKQSLQDANLLAVRITYGIPPFKQVPLAGRFYVKALALAGLGENDEFVAGLLEEGRIPIVARAVLRMSSEPFELAAVSVSSNVAGGGASGGGGAESGNGSGTGSGGVPGVGQHCEAGDPRCDPNCGVRLCCIGLKLPT